MSAGRTPSRCAGAARGSPLPWPCCSARRSPASRSISPRSAAASSTRPTSSRRRHAARIETKLADLEAKSGIQLVVATVSSLEGQEIEPYANELFRTWKLGEKDKNNGVLLLVAPNEHRVRIEVGYGLEGTLTDALSKVIIVNAITPRFKTGDFGGGISRGVDDIITVLTTDSSEWQKRPAVRLDKPPASDPMGWLIIAAAVIFVILFGRLARLSLAGAEYPGERAFKLGRIRPQQRRVFQRRRRLLRRWRFVGRRRRVGELVMELTAKDRKRIAGAIRAAEAKTSGEIVCVLARSPRMHRRCRY